MALALAAVAAAGTTMSAMGQIQAGNAQRRVGEMNAQIAEANAAQSEVATADKLQQLERQTSVTLGRQKAGFAASGVRPEGSPLEILAETTRLAGKDAYRISEAGRFEAAGARFKAAQERYMGSVAQQQSRIGAATTLLSGFGQIGLAYGFGSNGARSTVKK